VQQWLRQCLPTLQGWMHSQTAMLESLGWQCLPSDANFFCAQPPVHTDLAGLLQHLRGQGIKLRDAASLGLPGHERLSAQPPEAQQALQAALTAWAAAHGEPTRVDRLTEGVAPAAHPHNFLETSP
jgi:histidinol-phosphate aminotransferase